MAVVLARQNDGQLSYPYCLERRPGELWVIAGFAFKKGWQGTDYVGRSFRDDSVKARGTASMRLDNALDGDIVQVSQNVSVGAGYLQAGHTYRLRGRVKVERHAKPNAINLAALTPKLGSKGSWRMPLPAPGEEQNVRFEWQQETQTLKLAPWTMRVVR